MGRSPMVPQKQLTPESNHRLLTSEVERKFYEVIKSKQNMGIWVADLKKETNLHDPRAAGKALKSLQYKNLIKMVANVNRKAKPLYMAVEFEPAKEISGGSWYSEGSLDTEFIRILRDWCLEHIATFKVATVETIWRSIQDSKVFETKCSRQQVMEIVRAMVLDNKVEELKSSGEVCYTRSLRGVDCLKVGIMSSIPCGVCPRISECTSDGIISPENCVYYRKWLDLQF